MKDQQRADEQVREWMRTGEYLPDCLQDFHDQKEFFKYIAWNYREPGEPYHMPSWVDANIYTIDYFLWCMARHGYTLQRSRKRLPFRDIAKTRDAFRKARLAQPLP